LRSTRDKACLCVLAAVLVAGAADARAQLVVYLNRDGGIYSPGEPNDSRTNVSSVPDAPVSIPPWEIDETSWSEVVTCVQDLFGPFGAVATDVDPGDQDHIEAVVGGLPGLLGLDPNAAGVSPFRTDCSVIDNSIVFVFPEVLVSNRQVCEAIAQEVAHSVGLDHQYLCEDPMTYLTGCGDKKFRFRDSICGELEPRDCKCTRTQNSARLLLDRLGSSERPTLWINDPTGEEPVAEDALVRVAVTNQPNWIELFVDGEIIDNAPAVTSATPYELVELTTFGTMSSGTHELTVRSYWNDGTDSTESVEVEVIDSDSRRILGGCQAAGRAGRGAWLGLLAVMALAARRRRPRAVS
jgi:hypothetical protein